MIDFKKFKYKKYLAYVIIGIFMIVTGIMTAFDGIAGSSLILLEKIAISIILALSLSLVVGFLGELSLGHAGFMCVGAYLGGKISALLVSSLGNGILALLISVIAGGVCAGVCGFIVGLPALRLKGDYLAIVTLAFGEIVRTLFRNTSAESFGGPIGLKTPRFDRQYLFIICFVFVLITLFVVQNLIRSKHGRAITAIRDNEIAARATGINVTKYKLWVFVIAAIFAGIAGVLFSYSNIQVSSAKFDYNYSIEILVMVVLGGMGSINGSIIVATLITFLNEILGKLPSELAVAKNLVYAIILIAVVIYNNSPALKGFREKYNFKALIGKITRGRFGTHGEDAGRWDVVPTKIKMDAVISTDFIVSDDGEPDKPEDHK